MNSVAYSPLDGLVDLACRDGVDIRPTLLRVLTDLFVQKPMHSAVETTQYVELALGLVDTVDAPTRTAVTERLAAYPAAPAKVLDRLRGAPAQPAPKSREEDLASLFFMAGADERRLILMSLDAAAEPARHPPAPASNEMLRQLEASALQRNAAEAARLLTQALHIGEAIAARIVRDHSGEPFVVAAKALGMKAAMLQRIVLFLNRQVGQSIERVYGLAQLYDEITPAAAAQMLAIWRQCEAPPRPVHAPLHWDDEPRSARATSSSAPQHETRTDDERRRSNAR